MLINKGCKERGKTKQISNSRVVLFSHADSDVYLTFTVKTQSNNLIYEGNEYSVLQQILHKVISFMHYEQDMSFRKISAFLNRSGIKTIRGRKWSITGSSAHSVLKKKRLREERLTNRKEKFDYEIVDMDIKVLE